MLEKMVLMYDFDCEGGYYDNPIQEAQYEVYIRKPKMDYKKKG